MHRFHPLNLLRQFASKMGEIGGLLIVIILLPVSIQMMDPAQSPALNIPPLLITIGILLAVYARKKDSDGHRAMKRQRKGIQKSAARNFSADTRDANAHYLKILGLSNQADESEIRSAARRVLRNSHNDTASGPIKHCDLDDIVKARDALIEMNSLYGRIPTGIATAEQQLAVWRNAAGPLGMMWGAMLPSTFLSSYAEETGESLLPNLSFTKFRKRTT